MGGFQFLLILDLCGMRFHAVVVFDLGKNLFFKSVLGHCDGDAQIRGLLYFHYSSNKYWQCQSLYDCSAHL